jgi:hypothetical protein
LKGNQILRDYTPEFFCDELLLNPFLLQQNKFSQFKPKNNLMNNPSRSSYKPCNFSYYLCGLIEGDGTIFVPNTSRSAKGKKNYPSVQIDFHLSDLPLALMIQKEFGYGSICRRKGEKTYTFTINNWEGILRLIFLLNGKMKTPKIAALYRLIDWVNEKPCTRLEKAPPILAQNSGDGPSAKIPKLPRNSEHLSQNAWLSGFIEAEGHFSIRTTSAQKAPFYHKVECKFELVQALIPLRGSLGYPLSEEKNLHSPGDAASLYAKVEGPLGSPKDSISHEASNRLIMLEIADFFQCSMKEIRTSSKNPQYRIRTTNVFSNTRVEGYLTTFPLFGKKSLDFLDWLKILALFQSGRYKHKEGIEEARKIKERMNDRRTCFVWEHLQHFYHYHLEK